MNDNSQMDHRQFLQFVAQYVEKNPDVAAHVANHVQAGLNAALSVAKQRAADMETIAAVLASKRYRGADELVTKILEKWDGKTSLNWDWLLRPKTPESEKVELPDELPTDILDFLRPLQSTKAVSELWAHLRPLLAGKQPK